jgi:hypothetical protein
MMMNRQKLYPQNDKALVTTEFAVIAFGLLTMIFLVVEMTTLYFTIMSAQMAAHMGARVAVISDPSATISSASPPVNDLTASGIYGTNCGDATAPCKSTWSPVACDGSNSGCSGNASFARVLTRMQQFLGGLQAKNVKITYTYSGAGFAGGPATPLVTVTISCVPYKTGIIGVFIGSFVNKAACTSTDATVKSFVPTVSVTLMGEDLAT